MAANKLVLLGPYALTTTLGTNILNCNVTSLAGPVGITLTQPYLLIYHIHVYNKTASAATFSLWIGASGANAAGTELYSGQSVPPNAPFDAYGLWRLDATNFLVGGAGTATALTLTMDGEVGF